MSWFSFELYIAILLLNKLAKRQVNGRKMFFFLLSTRTIKNGFNQTTKQNSKGISIFLLNLTKYCQY